MANKVKAAFRDKFTKKEYKKGDTYEHKDAERIAFLVDKGFLAKGKATTKKAEK